MSVVRTSLVLAAAAAAVAHAQPQFRSAVNLVTVQLTVTTHEPTGRVGELGPADFRVYEDGRLQEVALVNHEPRALSLCILLDSSPSMAAGRQALAIRTIETLLKELAPDDEASLHFFSSRVHTVFSWTPARELKPVSWLEWRLSLGTALIDAIEAGLAEIEKASNPLPVIVVVSDGGENASGASLASLVSTRRQSETQIYAVHTDLSPSRFAYAPPINRAFTNFLPQVVGDSGGTIHRVRTPDEGEHAALALLRELRSQYTLGYTPSRPFDGKYRTIKVEAVDPRLSVRHRGGYLALPAK